MRLNGGWYIKKDTVFLEQYREMGFWLVLWTNKHEGNEKSQNQLPSV